MSIESVIPSNHLVPVIPFYPCLQSFPASGSFLMSQIFTSGGQSVGASASSSVLPMNISDWFPLGLTRSYSLQSKGLACESESCSVVSDFLQPHGLYSPGILQARKLEWVAFPSPGDLPNPRIKLSHKGSPILQFENISSSVLNLLYGPTLTSVHDYWKNHCFDCTDLCWQSNVSAF